MVSKILKGSSKIFSIKAIGAIFLILSSVLISRKYGAQSFGVFSIYFALLQLLAMISRLGMDVYIVRVLPTISKNRNKISDYFTSILVLIIISCLIVLIIFSLLIDLIDLYFFQTLQLNGSLQTISYLILPFTIFSLIPEIFRGFNKIAQYAVLKNLILNLLLFFFVLLGTDLKNTLYPLKALNYSILISFSVSLIWLSFFLKSRRVKFKSKAKDLNKHFRKAYPMYLSAVLVYLISSMDNYLIGLFMNEKSVGYFNACLKLTLATTFIMISFNGYLAPRFSELFHKKNIDELNFYYNKAIKIILILSLPIIIILSGFPSFFLKIFGDEFVNASRCLIILNLSSVVVAFFGLAGTVLNMSDQQSKLLKIIFSAFVIKIIFAVVLIPLFGLDGAATSFFIATCYWNIKSYIVVNNLILKN
jgi:O-antigen/teichoic acid export membrane protein